MFQKVQLRLTLLCGGITTVIMIFMTLGYLYISEKNLKETQFLSFTNNINTITTNLEQQSVISYEWLSKLENNGKYQIFLMDNHTPFLFNNRSNDFKTEKLFEEAYRHYQNLFSVESVDSSIYFSFHLEYPFTSSEGEEYYATVITIEKQKSLLEVLILSSLEPMKKQLQQQRLLFLGIISYVLIILWIFSYLFIKKLLSPIEKNRVKQIQFVASASHELRTPLAVIISCLESLKQAPADKKDHFLMIMETEANRMSALVGDMLTLSRSDNHTFSIQKKEVELDTLLLNCYEAFEPMAKKKSLALSIHLPDTSLPPCHCDQDRINQVIAILLHNAISYTPEGGSIHLSLKKHKSKYQIMVSDTGIGIPDEEKDKIFDRFYRSEKSRSAKGHFGLGLCIASELIQAHNGSVKVSDTKGGGATFIISLPA